MKSINSKIGLIGCGNMGEALIRGLLAKGVAAAGKILVSDKRPSRRRYIQRRYGVRITSSNEYAAKNCGIIILAAKPQDIDGILADIKEVIHNKLIISIAAGIKTKRIQKALPRARVIRAMPNTPALIGYGAAVISRSKSAGKKDCELAKKIFGSVGAVIEADEGIMDIVTAASGSGPAYFFLLADSMIKAASSLGLDEKTSRQLVLNTALGSSMLALRSDEAMDKLIKKVASKGGTTEAALKVFRKRNFQKIVKEAVKAAAERSKELSK